MTMTVSAIHGLFGLGHSVGVAMLICTSGALWQCKQGMIELTGQWRFADPSFSIPPQTVTSNPS